MREVQYLLLIILSLVVDDVEEAELVNTLGGGDDTEPVTELLLLEELLGTARDINICATDGLACGGTYRYLR